MYFSFYQLCWFYFIYSFIGWCGEVCAAAVKKKKFINRGFVSGPFCPIYGAGAAAFAVFLPELTENPFFLFLGGVILASFIEFTTGALLEKLFHKKWWDYSKMRFNFEGYICARYSLLWGGFALLAVYLVNPVLVLLLGMIPYLAGIIILWGLAVFLVLDTVGTSLAIRGMQKRMEQLTQLTEGIGQVSHILENAITQKIVKRMEKAFPAIAPEILKRDVLPKEKSEVFARGCGFYKLFSLFLIGAFLGDITETVFCLITTGRLMSRSSVVYGPFSIVWGLGCGLLTAVLYRIREKSDSYIFVAGTLLGGAYEYICSVFTELVFGTVFWDYSGFRFNLGGRINLLYCFFWGIAAVVWMKLLYPRLSSLIEKLPKRTGTILCNILIVFMAVNCLISALALARYGERQAKEGAVQAETVLEEFLDDRFDDERMERIYPNAKVVN